MAAGLTKQGEIRVAPVDRMGINMELRKYKDANGAADFRSLLVIPLDKRINAMAERDMRTTVTTIAVALTLAMETMNLKRPMNGLQIVDLAEAIVDSSLEDKIAVEDLMLFLQELTRGKYGELYESFDAIKFMSLFGKFRDKRWEEGLRIRDEKVEYHKSLGDSDTFNRTFRKPESAFGQHLSEFNQKLQAKNDEIRALKEERKRNR